MVIDVTQQTKKVKAVTKNINRGAQIINIIKHWITTQIINLSLFTINDTVTKVKESTK